MIVRSLPDSLVPLVEQPAASGLFCDFDGTMAEIVLDPGAAAPVAGAVEAMTTLAGRLGRVGVLSGRPLAFLEQFFGDDLLLAGLYGLEWSERGGHHDHPQAGAWREVIADMAACAEGRGPEGMRVEPKGLSITLHYRERPEQAGAVRAWADEQASRSGLVARSARMSIELHPPIDADKGSALLAAADDLRNVVFCGDDLGDLEAFDALDELAARGVHVVRVAVASDEVDEQLTSRADLVVDGPADVVRLLTLLAERSAT